jgi:predicted metalloprotease with PDZ domain
MYVDGHKQDAIDLKIEKPTSWKLMSGAADDADQSEFHFNNYDLLIDTPVEMGNFDLSTFELDGHTYRIALHALMPFHNKDLLLKELPRIVQAETAIFGPPECDKYTFLIHLVPTAQATDGMEHLNSTQIIEDSYDDLLATAAHEFFHLWNVKRIRPAGLGPWDYTREVYTKDLWICEGLTSYYGDLSLTRAGLWSHPRYYQEIAQEIAELQQRPGRKFMSLELSSWDSWLFLATPRAQLTNHDNTTISYYNKGEIVGLMLDLELRERTMNRKSLDDVFRFMYAEYYQHAKKESYYLQGEAYAPGDFLRAVERVSGADFSAFFRAYISGTEEINYNTFLGYAGLKLEENRNKDGAYQITEIPHANAQQLAIRNSWLNNQPVRANK